MFKKQLLLLMILFCQAFAIAQGSVEEVKSPKWSTKKKVIIGTVAVVAVTATGVVIYYGPAAVAGYIHASFVAAKAKEVALTAKAMGATHVYTVGEGSQAVTYVITGKDAATLATTFIAKEAGKSLTEMLKNSDIGSTIRVFNSLNDKNMKLVPHDLLCNNSTVLAMTPTDKITFGDANRAINFTKDSAECVLGSIKTAYDVLKEESVREELSQDEEHEEWVPHPMLAEKFKQIYVNEPLRKSMGC